MECRCTLQVRESEPDATVSDEPRRHEFMVLWQEGGCFVSGSPGLHVFFRAPWGGRFLFSAFSCRAPGIRSRSRRSRFCSLSRYWRFRSRFRAPAPGAPAPTTSAPPPTPAPGTPAPAPAAGSTAPAGTCAHVFAPVFAPHCSVGLAGIFAARHGAGPRGTAPVPTCAPGPPTQNSRGAVRMAPVTGEGRCSRSLAPFFCGRSAFFVAGAELPAGALKE